MPSPSYSLRYAACDTNGSCPSKFHSKLKKLVYFAFLSWGFLFLSHIWPPSLSIFKALSLLSNSHEMFPNSAPTHLNWAWVSSGTIPEILASAYSCPCPCPYSSPWLSDVASISMDTSEVKDLCSSCFFSGFHIPHRDRSAVILFSYLQNKMSKLKVRPENQPTFKHLCFPLIPLYISTYLHDRLHHS